MAARGQVVGYHVEAEEGMRVKLRESTAARFPALLDETGGTVGTVTWADPEDADGDGWTGPCRRRRRRCRRPGREGKPGAWGRGVRGLRWRAT
jgi:hypothetical protein